MLPLKHVPIILGCDSCQGSMATHQLFWLALVRPNLLPLPVWQRSGFVRFDFPQQLPLPVWQRSGFVPFDFPQQPPPRCHCAGGCTFRTAKRASCESSYVKDQCRITVHYGTIYVLVEFWWWMTAIAKVVLSPPALFWMVQWNRYTDHGKTISTMGMINFWPEKKFRQFFVRQRFPPFSESSVSI